MSIPLNPIPTGDEQPEENGLILGENNIPALEEPVEETEETPIVESTFTDLDEPGEMTTPATAPKKATKPALIALVTMLGLVVLCCIMAGIMFLLLRTEIFSTGL